MNPKNCRLVGMALLTALATPLALAAELQLGYANPTATHITVDDKVSEPQKYTQAICNGDIYPIQFQKTDTANVYQINAKTKPNLGVCVLFEASENLSPITFTEQYHPCSPALNTRLKSLKGDWSQKACLAKSNQKAGIDVGLIEYKPKAQKALGRLFLNTQNNLYSVDFPATLKDQSCWRVDDNCEFITAGDSAMHVPFVINLKSGLGLLMVWPGAEGVSASFYQLKAGKLTEVKNYYHYQTPL
jgi:hypothetical protein